jgi:hypothetical protein
LVSTSARESDLIKEDGGVTGMSSEPLVCVGVHPDSGAKQRTTAVIGEAM